MKKTIGLILFFAQINLFGQVVQEVNLQKNLILNDAINSEYQYIYKEFQHGRINYKNNQIAKGKLNYNILLDEVQFINEKGEIMAVANPNDITTVTIGTFLFVPFENKGYYELIESGNITLFFKWKCRVVEIGKPGALGITDNTSNIKQYEKVWIEYKLEMKRFTNVSVEVVPYLKKGTRFVLANQTKGFLKVFGHKELVQTFINENKIDINKEEDLVKLTRYCNSLN